jgi:hypothetical protein
MRRGRVRRRGVWLDAEAHGDFGLSGPAFDFEGGEAELSGEGVEVAAQFEVAEDARDVCLIEAVEVGVGELGWARHVDPFLAARKKRASV